MNISFDPSVAQSYKSNSQRARVLTENWASRNLYCPACKNENLEQLQDNTKVFDFICTRCSESFQLKSQQKPIGGKVVDSAYQPMLQAIRENRTPNFFLLHYDPLDLCVENLLLIPRHFVSTSCIEARQPLSEPARRAGWVGCLINITRVPSQARIFIVKKRIAELPSQVSKQYSVFRFLNKRDWRLRGWTADVLACIDKFGKREFTLQEVYGFEKELRLRHPGNFHVRDKIRQQLQVLRDHRILSFSSRGHYKKDV